MPSLQFEMSFITQTGHAIARVLGIKLDYRDDIVDDVTRGESVLSNDSFIEHQPTSGEWIRDLIPSSHELLEYTRSLFPFTYWIGQYNLQWLLGDLVAGKFRTGHEFPRAR